MSRCDSAAIVSKTNELLPDPETPVKTVSRRLGSSTLTSLRLFSRAPTTRIMSWLSATCGVRGVMACTLCAGSAPRGELEQDRFPFGRRHAARQVGAAGGRGSGRVQRLADGVELRTERPQLLDPPADLVLLLDDQLLDPHLSGCAVR